MPPPAKKKYNYFQQHHCLSDNKPTAATMATNRERLRDLVARQNRVIRGEPSTGSNPTLNNLSTASTPTSPSPEPPLTFLDMPRNNVFLKHRKPSTPGFRDQWTDEEYQQAAIIAAQQDAINERLSDRDNFHTAATSHFRDRYYSARINFDCNRMMEVLIFRYGSVPDELVTTLINLMPKGVVNSSNENVFRKKLIAHQTQAKANTKSFLSLSMKQLLVEVPGFRNATKEARISLLVRMFKQFDRDQRELVLPRGSVCRLPKYLQVGRRRPSPMAELPTR